MPEANALDPGYGGYANTNRLIAAPSNGPQQLGQTISNAQGAVQLSQQEYQLANDRLGSFSKIASSIMADPSADNLTARLGEAVQAGVIPSEMASQALSTTASMNDQQRGQWAFQHWQTLANMQQQLDTAYGAPALVNQGGKLGSYMVKQGPQGGYAPAPSGVGSIPTTLTPGEKTGRVDYVDPNGGKVSQSVGQLYDERGNFIGAAGQGGSGAGNGGPAGQSPPVGGVGNPNRVVQPVQAQPQPAGSGGALTTGLSPGQSSALAGSSDAWQGLAKDVASPSGVSTRVFQLEQALGALRNTGTGLGTAGRQKLLSYVAALPGGVGKWIAGDPDKLSDYDLANKYLTAYSLNTPGAARSDAGLDTAGAANASTSINPQAAQEVTLSNIGLERMKQAQASAFIQSGQDPGHFTNWSAGFTRNLDPKAFALGSMTPQERGKLYSGLQGKALTNFNQSVRVGLKTGILTRDDLAGAAGDGQ